MNVLSLFDGLSCCHLALDEAGIEVEKYYAAEIDKYATQVSEHNYPSAVRLGDVTKWKDWDIDWSSIDLVTAGFPCQSWSMAGQQLGDKDDRGMLFWTTLDIISNVLKHNPSAKFMMENVKMKKEFEEYITHHTEEALGYVEKTLINSALVSAQNRNRYYWTNFKVAQPKDKGVLLRDIVDCEIIPIDVHISESIRRGYVKSEQNLTGESQTLARAIKNTKAADDKGGSLTACAYKGMGTNGMTNVLVKCGALRGRYIVDGKRQDHKMLTAGLTEQRLELRKDNKSNTLTTVQKDNVLVRVGTASDIKGHDSLKRIYSTEGKSPTLTTMRGGHRQPKIATDELHYRKLTPLECERLQTIPDNFTLILNENGKQLVSNSQRYKMIGNGWTVDVIAHIFKELKDI